MVRGPVISQLGCRGTREGLKSPTSPTSDRSDGSDQSDESDESEMVLWRRLFDEAGILLTPGVGFGHGRPGLFRIVYPSVPRAELEVAMKRLAGFVQRARD